jgi:hypothetical protein
MQYTFSLLVYELTTSFASLEVCVILIHISCQAKV